MNELLLVFFIGAPLPSPALCCATGTPAFVQAAATKESRDNVGHFISPAVLTTSFYGTALYFGAKPNKARWISAGLALTLVVGKEFYDQSVAGRFGIEEALIGVAGTASGLWLAEKIEWPEEKRVR